MKNIPIRNLVVLILTAILLSVYPAAASASDVSLPNR